MSETGEPDELDDEHAFGDEVNESDIGGSGLHMSARRALATLLAARFITRSRHRATWDAILAYELEIRERLEDLFLVLVIDRDYEVAFKRQSEDEDAPKVLRRDKPLSRDASFLLIYLRKEHAYTDATGDPVVINRSQIAEFLRPFREDGDADEAKFDRRVDAAIRAMADLKLLTRDPDADFLFIVSPAVVPLVGVDELMRMEETYLRAANGLYVVADNGEASTEDGSEAMPDEVDADADEDRQEWA